MEYFELGVGVLIGIAIGLIMIRFIDRRHQRVVKKLVESRRKIERQRTQVVNDLFALRAEIEEGTYSPQPQPEPVAGHSEPDPRLLGELANLRSLIARADGALTAARRKRDENEAEIVRLRAELEERNGENVISFRPQDRPDGRAGNLAL